MDGVLSHGVAGGGFEVLEDGVCGDGPLASVSRTMMALLREMEQTSGRMKSPVAERPPTLKGGTGPSHRQGSLLLGWS